MIPNYDETPSKPTSASILESWDEFGRGPQRNLQNAIILIRVWGLGFTHCKDPRKVFPEP